MRYRHPCSRAPEYHCDELLRLRRQGDSSINPKRIDMLAETKLEEITSRFKLDLIKDIHIILSSFTEGSVFVFDKTRVVLRDLKESYLIKPNVSYLVISLDTNGSLSCVSHDWETYFSCTLDDISVQELAHIHDVLVRQEFQRSEPVRVSD